MKLIFLVLLFSSGAFAQQGVFTDYLRLQPTALPAVCNQGDVRFASSPANLNVCSSTNNWTAFTVSSTAPLTTFGDTMYENSSLVPARLPGNTSATKMYLSQTGTGTISGIPAWSQPAFSELSGSVNLASQVSGNLSVNNLNSGTAASSTTFWRGDGTWASGGGAWGSITGTLSSQTDLNTALGLKAPLASPTFTGTVTLPTTAGILKSSSGGVISDATSGTDYSAGTSALSTGIVKSTTTTGALTIAVAADFPTLNQNTTGSSASFTGNLAGDVTGTQGATVVGKINGTALSGLATGILKNTTTTGVPSIATAGTDYVIPSGNITGTSANITGTSNTTLTSLSNLVTVGTIGTGTWAGTTVATAHGGTGVTTTPTQWGVVYAPTTSTLGYTAAGSAGNVLTSNGTSAPTFQAAGASVTGNYFNGYMASTGSGWTTASTTFATPTGGTNTLTTRKSNGITVTAGTGPAITFTPTASTSVYLVAVSFTSFVGTPVQAYYQITDGTNILWSGTNDIGSSGASISTGPLVYVPGTGSAITLTIQAATANGSDTVGILNGSASPQVNAIEWQVVQLK